MNGWARSLRDRWEIRLGEREYPSALLELQRPPEVIRGVGNPESLLTLGLGIVGSRRASPYGCAICKMAGRVAAECGVRVISGGAMGCDFEAGMAAYEAGGSTIVVAGTGADVPYPDSSLPVFEAACESGGAVISMERWGQGPRRYAFPRRNSVVAALSHVVLVAEAGHRSGTMSTAEAAVELGRELYAVPGSIFSPLSAGTNRLAAEGARIIPDAASLEMAIAFDFGSARMVQETPRRSLGPVMSALVACPSRIDELSRALGEDVLTVLKTLTDLEARGLVQRLPDGRYSPTDTFLLGQNS